MAKRIDWTVNVDKLRVCYNMPENLYDYLREHYTRHDKMTNARILDEDDFSLVFIEEDDTKMSAVLNVKDVDGFSVSVRSHSPIVPSMRVRRSSRLRTGRYTVYIRECRTENRRTTSATCCMLQTSMV